MDSYLLLQCLLLLFLFHKHNIFLSLHNPISRLWKRDVLEISSFTIAEHIQEWVLPIDNTTEIHTK